MVAIWRAPQPARRPRPVKRALYTEKCQDEDGNLVNIIVWRDWPGSSLTSYTLEDGSPVHYEDECHFATTSGKMLTRFEE